MSLSRRDLLAGAATFPVAAALGPRIALAQMSIGSAQVTTVSDGNLVLPGQMIFAPIAPADLAPLLTEFDLSATELTPQCNVTLFQDGDRTVLFDTGAGPDFMPSAGRLADSLDAMGLTPQDVTHVVFTHAHPDHIWGVLDDFDDPLFPQATYMMGRAEWEYWWDPNTVTTIGDARASFAVGAKRRMAAIEAQVTLFDADDEVLPGVLAVSTPGHTPGHMAFELRQGSEAVMILGDAVGNHHLAFRHPDWHSGADQDPETAAKTRRAIFDRVTHEQTRLIGFHLPQGGIGRAEAHADGGYRFVPE